MPLGEARNRIAEVIDCQLFVGDHTVNIDMPINIPSTFASASQAVRRDGRSFHV